MLTFTRGSLVSFVPSPFRSLDQGSPACVRRTQHCPCRAHLQPRSLPQPWPFLLLLCHSSNQAWRFPYYLCSLPPFCPFPRWLKLGCCPTQCLTPRSSRPRRFPSSFSGIPVSCCKAWTPTQVPRHLLRGLELLAKRWGSGRAGRWPELGRGHEVGISSSSMRGQGAGGPLPACPWSTNAGSTGAVVGAVVGCSFWEATHCPFMSWGTGAAPLPAHTAPLAKLFVPEVGGRNPAPAGPTQPAVCGDG